LNLNHLYHLPKNEWQNWLMSDSVPVVIMSCYPTFTSLIFQPTSSRRSSFRAT
jgi:hypothetical protein